MSWEKVKVEDIAEINPRLPKDVDQSQEVSFLAMASVSEQGKIIDEEIRILSETKKGFTYFERGDIIVAKITPCFENGKAVYLSELTHQVGFGSTEFHVIRADTTRVDPKYLFFMLWNDRFRHAGARKMTGSAGQRRVPAQFIKSLEIPLPPLKVQEQIASVLEKADALRHQCQQMDEELNILVKSVFWEMFGDPKSNPKGFESKPFGKLITALRNGISPSNSGSLSHKVLTLSAVTHGAFNGDALKTGTFNEAPDESKLVSKDDLLICRGNGNKNLVGAGVFPTHNINDVVFPDTVIGAKVDTSQIEPLYLETYWASRAVRDHIETGARTTNGTYKINQTVIKSAPILVPEKTLQKSFVSKAKAIADTREINRKRALEVEQNFNSLMQSAFKGELKLKPRKQ